VRLPGVVNDAAEFALWLSPHILAIPPVLATVLKTPDDEVNDYLRRWRDGRRVCGGITTTAIVGTVRTGRTTDPYLAAAVGAFLIVSPMRAHEHVACGAVRS